MVVKHRHALLAHGTINVKVAALALIDVCLAANRETHIERVSAILTFLVDLLRHLRGEVVAEEREGHPGVDVVGIVVAARVGARGFLDAVWIVGNHADLARLLDHLELLKFMQDNRQEVGGEHLFLVVAKRRPLSDEVDEGVFEDGGGLDAEGEVHPGYGVGSNGFE